ncbi:hypothetical protein KC19_9G103100 [Ceratodon purpureus]|uniref:Senescence domain-containing protein n=1 Tax=Ceratodon purpureus TaxID=3225 RepID=A0A8T0GQM4_CERPU|nr:hypothetical protein KC19_9G103100 [Ceratodon purpureus]
MNWIHRNNPFEDDRDRYGYPPSGFDQADMRYGYGYSSGYDSYGNSRRSSSSMAPQRSMDYDYGYEAPLKYQTSHLGQGASSYDHYGRYEPDERYGSYAEQPVYSRYSDYEEPSFYGNGYRERSYGDEPEDGLFRTESKSYDFRQVTTTAVTEPGYGGAAEVLEASEDVLVRIRGAMVHLVDDQESPLLAEGDFSVVRIEQEGNGIVAFVRVGDNLRWPLTKDEPVVKLDSSHYFFTIRVPRRVDDMDRDTAGASQECMSYGVTFSAAGQERMLRELDDILEQYSGFSSPQLVHGDRERDEFDGAFGYGHGNGHNQPPRGRPVPEEVVSSKGKRVSESDDEAFWRTMAPNVDDYNSELAKTMAKGTGNLIKGIFWLRDSTLAQLENGSGYVRGRVKPSSKPSNISPQTLTNLKRVMNMSIATEQVAKSVLDGVVKAAGFFSGALMRSQAGKKFFNLLPGEVALVSMDAFGMFSNQLSGHM